MKNDSTGTFAFTTNNGYNEIVYISVVVSISMPIAFLDSFTTLMIFISKKLRKPTNYPIASLLLGSVIQSVFVLPIYIHQELKAKFGHRTPWSCDLYRFTYFYTQHIMKVSLLFISFDRLIVIKYPFRYHNITTKFSLTVIIIILWTTTFLIDVIPIFPSNEKAGDKHNCTYVPTRNWGLSVITLFDIIPFILITANYIILWRLAASIEKKDRQQCSVNQRKISVIQSDVSTSKEHVYDELSNGTGDNEGTMEVSTKNKNGFHRNISSPLDNQDSKMTDFKISEIEKESKKFYVSSKHPRSNNMSLKLALEMKATKTAVLFCFAYLLCWGPMGIFYMIDHFCYSCMSRSNKQFFTEVRRAIKSISLSSSVILPLVYCWRTKQFRDETMRIFCRTIYHRQKRKK